jgi:tagatose-6-phosphate ketose/aldose isomerase
MDPLSGLLKLSADEKKKRGLVHTPAEIAQQPATWQSTFALFRQHQQEIKEFLSSAGVFAADPSSRPTVFLIGAGTSDYVGQSLAYLLRRMWQCEVLAIPSTDLVTSDDALIVPHQKYLWISFARSGDSPEGVAVLQRGLKKRPNIAQFVVCCNAQGRMVKLVAGRPNAFSICLDDEVNDRGLAMTSSFTNMVVFGQCLANVLSPEKYQDVLGHLVESAKSFLPMAAEVAAKLAQDRFTKACIIGSGAMRAVARESALKLLEMTAGKTLTMSESSLGLRHGPMAALDQDTLLVCFVSSDQRVQLFEKDLLQEIGRKKLVRGRVLVSDSPFAPDDPLGEYYLASRAQVHDDYRPPVDVILGQLLGLFFSLQRGLQPDSPSPSGAISRVVPNFNVF